MGKINLEQVNNPLNKFRNGFLAKTNSTTVVNVAEGSGRDDADSMDLILTADKTADITVSGKGGLDTGSEQASKWYAIHVIGDSGGVNATDVMLSLSDTAPTLPIGYDSFLHVDWVRNNASSNFLLYERLTDFYYHYKEPRTSITVLDTGSAITWTTVDASAFVPPSSKVMIFSLEFDTTSTANTFQARPDGSAITDPVISIRPAELSGATYIYPLSIMQLSDAQKFEYKVVQTNDKAWVYCDGFYDFIN